MNELSSSSEKYLVLGSTGYSGVTSVGWNNGDLPNIVDYDAVVVDVQALNDATLATISNKHFENLRIQLTRLLLSKGRIIVVSDFKRVHYGRQESPRITNNYSWCPIAIGINNESGKSLKVNEYLYSKYLMHLEQWLYYFFIPENYLTMECKICFGSNNEENYLIRGTPYIENRYGKTIAGSCSIEFYEDIDEIINHKISGEIVLLPLIEKFDHKEAVRLVLEELTGKPLGYTPPGWVDTVVVPQVPKVEKEIQRRKKKIDTLSMEIGQLTDKRNSLNSIVKLLYASGQDLEEIVKFCFEALGAEVTPAKYGQEEYVLRYDNKEYLVEVKGVSKSISFRHLRQLFDYMTKYEDDTGQTCNGILFGNSWRIFPPKERNTTDKREFPDNVINRAKQLDVALVSSTRFFEVYCQYMKDESKAPLIMKEILNHNGVIEFGSLVEAHD